MITLRYVQQNNDK